MDEEDNVTLCTAAIVCREKPPFSKSCPCSLCSFYYQDSVGSCSIAHISQSPLVCSHIYMSHVKTYISTWTYTQIHKHNHVFKYLLFDWLAHSTKLDGVG